MQNEFKLNSIVGAKEFKIESTIQVEEERDNLQKKIMQMEADLDQVQEGLQEATSSLDEAEKSKTQVGKMGCYIQHLYLHELK